MNNAFAAYPAAFVYDEPDNKEIDHLLWGDFVRFLGREQEEWAQVRVRGKTGWMRKDDVQERRPLEVNFVDIGQGDGCFIVTPRTSTSSSTPARGTTWSASSAGGST